MKKGKQQRRASKRRKQYSVGSSRSLANRERRMKKINPFTSPRMMWLMAARRAFLASTVIKEMFEI